MGWKSTIEIAREDALREVRRALEGDLTDEELEEVLEAVYGDRTGANFKVTPKPEFNPYFEGVLIR